MRKVLGDEEEYQTVEGHTVTYGALCDRLTSVTLDPGTFIFSHLLREMCA